MSKRDETCDAADELIDQLQSRLDAIAAICDKQIGLTEEDTWDARVLARGTPSRELRAALKRWLPTGGKGTK